MLSARDLRLCNHNAIIQVVLYGFHSVLPMLGPYSAISSPAKALSSSPARFPERYS